jgi:hypothetical protein
VKTVKLLSHEVTSALKRSKPRIILSSTVID